MKKFFLQHGQNLMEYTIILAVIVTVSIALGPMIKRQLQGMIKTAADQIGTQQKSEQEFNVETGYVAYSDVVSAGVTNKTTQEGRYAGVTDIYYADGTTTRSTTASVLGFQKNQEN